MYFDQLTGAPCTQKLVKIPFFILIFPKINEHFAITNSSLQIVLIEPLLFFSMHRQDYLHIYTLRANTHCYYSLIGPRGRDGTKSFLFGYPRNEKGQKSFPLSLPRGVVRMTNVLNIGKILSCSAI